MQDYEYNLDFRDFIAALNAEEVAYLIVGGYAFARHVKPRVTKDFDVWVEASIENAEALGKAGITPSED